MAFPCLSDGGTIADMVLLAAKTTRPLVGVFEILVIDDGSTDHALDVLIIDSRPTCISAN